MNLASVSITELRGRYVSVHCGRLILSFAYAPLTVHFPRFILSGLLFSISIALGFSDHLKTEIFQVKLTM